MAKLQQMHLMRNVMDTYGWQGIFLVQQAYEKVIRSNNEVECDPVDRKIWLLRILLKVQIFLWLCRWEGLITSDLRHKRMRSDLNAYPLCGLHSDSATHIFSSCLITDKIWRLVCLEPLPPWDAMWQRFINPVRPLGAMAAVLWCVWRARNDKLFQGRPVRCENVVKECWSLIHSWATFL